MKSKGPLCIIWTLPSWFKHYITRATTHHFLEQDQKQHDSKISPRCFFLGLGMWNSKKALLPAVPGWENLTATEWFSLEFPNPRIDTQQLFGHRHTLGTLLVFESKETRRCVFWSFWRSFFNGMVAKGFSLRRFKIAASFLLGEIRTDRGKAPLQQAPLVSSPPLFRGSQPNDRQWHQPKEWTNYRDFFQKIIPSTVVGGLNPFELYSKII